MSTSFGAKPLFSAAFAVFFASPSAVPVWLP
jgi:hypothetical protein